MNSGFKINKARANKIHCTWATLPLRFIGCSFWLPLVETAAILFGRLTENCRAYCLPFEKRPCSSASFLSIFLGFYGAVNLIRCMHAYVAKCIKLTAVLISVYKQTHTAERRDHLDDLSVV